MIILPSQITRAGMTEALVAAGIAFYVDSAGAHFSDETAALAIINAYAGSAAELAYFKTLRQADLDDQFDQHFDLAKFIRNGTATGITGAQVGAFLATVVNNYRTLRASIASAANVAAVNAINIAAGWPANP